MVLKENSYDFVCCSWTSTTRKLYKKSMCEVINHNQTNRVKMSTSNSSTSSPADADVEQKLTKEKQDSNFEESSPTEQMDEQKSTKEKQDSNFEGSFPTEQMDEPPPLIDIVPVPSDVDVLDESIDDDSDECETDDAESDDEWESCDDDEPNDDDDELDDDDLDQLMSPQEMERMISTFAMLAPLMPLLDAMLFRMVEVTSDELPRRRNRHRREWLLFGVNTDWYDEIICITCYTL